MALEPWLRRYSWKKVPQILPICLGNCYLKKEARIPECMIPCRRPGTTSTGVVGKNLCVHMCNTAVALRKEFEERLRTADRIAKPGSEGVHSCTHRTRQSARSGCRVHLARKLRLSHVDEYSDEYQSFTLACTKNSKFSTHIPLDLRP